MQIFLSHSGSKELVKAVAEAIGDLVPTASVWYSGEIGGNRWDDAIRENLEKSRALVVLATPDITTSVYVGFEIGFVDHNQGDQRIFVLRAGVSNQQLSTRPPLGFFQAYDLENADELSEFLGKLCAELNAKPFRRKTGQLESLLKRLSPLVEKNRSGQTPNSARMQPISSDYIEVKNASQSVMERVENEKDLEEFSRWADLFDKETKAGKLVAAYQSYGIAKTRIGYLTKRQVIDPRQRARLESAVQRYNRMTDALEALGNT